MDARTFILPARITPFNAVVKSAGTPFDPSLNIIKCANLTTLGGKNIGIGHRV